ncbi:MAG: tetratricopeptide repeat protein [Planctomycetes bacterium]|nr:tetratricopeptide repeat protein [Planctomycetota bacterium]
MRKLAHVFVASATTLMTLAGCRAAPTGPYSPPSTLVRSTSEAERLTQLAGELADGNPAQAELLLRQALTADLYHGPAHNNLGVLFLNAGKLYDASVEFEWARKLMPGHPDPRTNLAITLERAGRTSDAIDAYRAALEVAPEDLAATQGLASALLRSGRTDPALPQLLERITLQGSTEAWRAWARVRRTRPVDARRDRPPSSGS